MRRPTRRVGGSVGILVAAMIAVSCGSSAEHYVQLGDRNFKVGKFSDAALNYRKAIQKNPQLGEAYYGLGLAYTETADFQGAYQALTRAAELIPRRIDVKVKLADLVLGVYEGDQGNSALYSTLTALTNQILALDPDSYDGIRMKGNLALFDKKPDQAVQLFQRANEIKPFQDNLVIGYAQALIQAGRGPEAVKLAHQLIERRKDFGPIYDVLSRYYLSTGDGAAVEEILREKIRNIPADSSAFIQLASYYRQVKEPTAMQAALDELQNSYATRKDAFLRVGDFYVHFGEWEKAASAYEKGSQVQPGQSGSFKKRLAAARIAQGRIDEALDILGEVLTKAPEDRDAKVAKAGVLVQRAKPGDLDQAILTYQAVLKGHPADQAALLGLGKAYLAKQDLASAKKPLRVSAQNDQEAAEPRTLLARISMMEGKPAEALIFLDELLRISPENAAGRYMKVNAQMMLGQYNEARPELDKLAREYPQWSDLTFLRGLLAILSKRYQEAQVIFSKLTASGSDVRFASGLAEAYIGNRQFDKALQVLDLQARKSPEQPIIRQMLAKTAMRAGQYDRAISEMQVLLKQEPNSSVLLTDLGQAYQSKGDIPKAIEAFKKAIQHGTKDPRPFFLLAYTLNAAGRPEEAISTYRQALSITPNDSLAMNNLAYALAEDGKPKDLDEALRLAERALEVSPNEPDLQDTLGWVWLKKGKADQALQLFTNLSGKAPANPSYRYHLGLALAAKGSMGAAQENLELALANHPSQAETVEIKDALRQASSKH